MIQILHPSGWRTNRWRAVLWGTFGLVLVTPLAAMQFTDQVDWTFSDFAAAALLLGGTGLLLELLSRSPIRLHYKATIAGLLVVAALLIWAEGAVGIFR